MKPAIYNLEIEQGARYRRTFTFPEDIDLTNANLEMQIRQTPGGKVFWTSSDLKENDIFQLDGQTLTLEIASTTTSTFKFSIARYDLDLNEDRWIKGKVILNKEVNNE